MKNRIIPSISCNFINRYILLYVTCRCTGKWGDANTMAYERSQHGHAKFGGSVYGPRLVDTMDEFARASVKSGVNPRRINRLVAQHQHKHANSAKSSSNKKKSNRN